LRFTIGIDELLEDPGALLVEVAPEPALYEHWHLPGAIMMSLEALGHPSRRDIAPRRLLEERLGGLGISDEDELVLYSDLGNRYAYYALWILWCHGSRNARVLDGGKAGWKKRGLPREVEPRSRPASRFRLDDPDWSDRISMGELLSRLEDPSLMIIDARSPEEYSGREGAPPDHLYEQPLMWGHMPGAVNIPWDSLYRDGMEELKDPGDVQRTLLDAGIRKDQEVAVYCRTGARASLPWFCLRHVLGFPRVRLYDGGWAEWGNAMGTPIDVEAVDRGRGDALRTTRAPSPFRRIPTGIVGVRADPGIAACGSGG